MDDLQSIGRYYSFPSTHASTATRSPAARRLVTVAARHLDLRALGPDARGWANDRFAYTHGYGVVAVSPQADVDSGSRASPQQRLRARSGTRSACASRGSTSASSPAGAAVPGRAQPAAARSTSRSRDPRARLSLRRRRRHRALEPAPAGRVRRAVRRPQAAADRDDHGPVADHPAPRRGRAAAHAGAVPGLGLATRRPP